MALKLSAVIFHGFHKLIACKVEIHISPGEPYFATFYDNAFQCAEANFGHFFEAYYNSLAENIPPWGG